MSEQRFTIQKASGVYLHLPIFDNDVEMADGDVCILLNEQQATIEQLRQSQDVKEFSALFNQSIALQREIKDLKEENEWKGEYWWAVVNTKRVEDCFECRNKEVALKLCDFLNKATDDFKWQIRQCEKWSAIVKQLKEENKELRKELDNFKPVMFQDVRKGTVILYSKD